MTFQKGGYVQPQLVPHNNSFSFHLNIATVVYIIFEQGCDQPQPVPIIYSVPLHISIVTTVPTTVSALLHTLKDAVNKVAGQMVLRPLKSLITNNQSVTL
mmetsp:Transcript_32748/g.58734  ORF Transcript_32748/g.58734 Transcript_32748/m.58734 type:complete len:100 (+) Transcript_32748:1990-2289(+)